MIRPLVILSLALLAAVPAARATGAIEIEVVPLPFVIDEPGRYILTRNVSLPLSTDGIQVQADDVTIDLNGFRISGSDTNAVAIRAVSWADNLTVVNGWLTDSPTVPILAPGPGAVLRNLGFDRVAGAAHVGERALIEQCLVTGGEAIPVSQPVFALGDVGVLRGCVIQGITVVFSSGPLSLVQAGADARVEQCVIEGVELANNAGPARSLNGYELGPRSVLEDSLIHDLSSGTNLMDSFTGILAAGDASITRAAVTELNILPTAPGSTRGLVNAASASECVVAYRNGGGNGLQAAGFADVEILRDSVAAHVVANNALAYGIRDVTDAMGCVAYGNMRGIANVSARYAVAAANQSVGIMFFEDFHRMRDSLSVGSGEDGFYFGGPFGSSDTFEMHDNHIGDSGVHGINVQGYNGIIAGSSAYRSASNNYFRFSLSAPPVRGVRITSPGNGFVTDKTRGNFDL